MADPLSVVNSAPLTVVSSAPPAEGYWEDRGMAGAVWHPPGVAPGRDPTSRRADSAMVSGVPIIGSIAPEDALFAYAGAKKVAGAMGGQIGAAGRVLAGMQATLAYAAPAIKYEVTKTVLEQVGVPTSVAAVLAIGASGYRRGGAAAAEAATAESLPGYPRGGTTPPAPADPPAPHLDRTVSVPAGSLTQQQIGERLQYGTGTPVPMRDRAPVYAPRPTPTVVEPPAAPVSSPASAAAPAASPPDVPAPPAAAAPPTGAPTPPAASPPSAAWSPQRVRNEVGLAARRAKVTLSDDDFARADDFVRAGQTPEAAVQALAPPPPPPKATMSAAEMRTYIDLRKAGSSHPEAVDLLQAQRDLAARLGTPTSEAVRQAVAERNATGRWPAGTPGE